MFRNIKNSLTIFMAFILGIAVTTAGVGLVLAHGGNTNFLHSCVKTSGMGGLGGIRMILPNGSCNANETALDWTKVPWSSDFPLMCNNCKLSQGLTGGLFNGKDLSNSFLQGSDLSGNDFTNTTLTGGHFAGVNFSNAILQGKDLSNLDLTSTIFDSANITNVNFTGSDLQSVSFQSTNISGVNFTNSSLTNANMQGTTNASIATFTGVTSMAGAQIGSTDLSSVNFTGISFTDASLASSNLTSANFANTDLTRTNLNQATGFDTANRTNISYDDTVCPDGTNSNNNGDTCNGHLSP